ncbi:NAD(P)H-hydrate epimerase, partial [Escherichia coli]|uniref:NAD(P)H-hydrate epimerase n=2 Tax=Gammaproteobacteria TaxID=1236 RepID=UPI001EDBE09B
GMGNNAGDGYFLAAYLQQAGYQVTIFAAPAGESPDLAQAVQIARRHQLNIHSSFDVPDVYDCHVDALFGHGLNRNLDSDWQTVIKH